MNMVSGLVQKLRDLASEHYRDADETESTLLEAADVIEALSAKLAAVNIERSNQYYGETGMIKVGCEVRQELVEQRNKALELTCRMPLEGNEAWHGYVSGVMQTLGFLLGNIQYGLKETTGQEPEKACANCRHWESYTGACCNGYSDRRADFVDGEFVCKWHEFAEK